MNELYTALGLVITVLVNNVLGSTNAFILGQFDKDKFIKGSVKGISVGICLAALYGAGLLAPSISISMLDNIVLSLPDALKALVTGGFAYYGCLDLAKIKDLIGIKIGSAALPKEVENIAYEYEVKQ